MIVGILNNHIDVREIAAISTIKRDYSVLTGSYYFEVYLKGGKHQMTLNGNSLDEVSDQRFELIFKWRQKMKSNGNQG